MQISEAAAEARREYKRKWRQQNRDRIRAYDKTWREKHREHIAAYTCAYWEQKALELSKEAQEGDSNGEMA